MDWKQLEKDWVEITTFYNHVRKDVKHSVLKVLKEKRSPGIVRHISLLSLNNALLEIGKSKQLVKTFITKLNIEGIDALALQHLTTERLEEEVCCLEEKIKKLTLKNAALIEQVSAIQNISDKLISVNGRIYVSEDDVNAANKKFKQCEDTLKIKATCIDNLHLQLLDCQQELESCRMSHTQLERKLQLEIQAKESLQSQIVTKTAEEDSKKVMTLQKQLQEQQRKSAIQHDNIQKLSAENEKLLGQLQRLDENYQEAQIAFEENAYRIGKLQQQLEIQAKDRLQNQIVTKIVEEDSEKVMNLQKQLQEQQSKSAIQHDNIQKLSAENEKLLGQLQRLDENYQKAQIAFEEDANRMRKHIDELNQSLSKSSKERELFDVQIISLQQQLEQMKQQCASLSGERFPEGEDVGEDDSSATCTKETRIEANVSVISEDSEEDRMHVRNSLSQIERIREVIDGINLEIEQFLGTQEDKQYLHLKEMIILNVLKLDNIDTDGHIIIRQERKKVIERAYQLLDILNSKCSS